MNSFEEGYRYYEENAGDLFGTLAGSNYVNAVQKSIDELIKNLNQFEGKYTAASQLKGDIAEYWHADTFNINSAASGSINRATVLRSHEYGSVDITTNFGKEYGLKTYGTAKASANAQVGYGQYAGQVRIVPTDQLDEAIKYLERKIAKESINRPDVAANCREALSVLTDRIDDGNGVQSAALTVKQAEYLAKMAKEGKIDEKTLELLGISTNKIINSDYILKQATKAGTTAAAISMVLRIAPEIYKAIVHLIKDGEIDKDDIKKIGLEAIHGTTEGFIRGTVSAAITIKCQAGIWGKSLMKLNPSIIGAATVLAMNAMKNSYKVAIGKMTKKDFGNELVREIFATTGAVAGGIIGQSIVPVIGYLVGSFIGSVVGCFVHNVFNNAVLSFCIESGTTFFGLVEQDYELPVYVLEQMGIEVFEYENFEYDKFVYEKTSVENFEYERFDYESFPESIGITFLKRGVIGVNKIGYIPA